MRWRIPGTPKRQLRWAKLISESEMTGEKEAAGNVEEPAEELSEDNIDAQVAAVKQEQEDLASKT